MVQDVLVVTAPGSGAEVIPFLKTLDLPTAVAFTVAYTQVRPRLPPHAWTLARPCMKGAKRPSPQPNRITAFACC